VADNAALWEIKLAIFATEAEVNDTKERIARILCPDPDHAPPCPIPWQISASPIDAEQASSYTVLLEQVQAESKTEN
jgi:hypothetical protein